MTYPLSEKCNTSNEKGSHWKEFSYTSVYVGSMELRQIQRPELRHKLKYTFQDVPCRFPLVSKKFMIEVEVYLGPDQTSAMQTFTKIIFGCFLHPGS